ncbi:MAG: anhydro-N-acetylmuramic acid kinase [Flavobacteriaceae bacterium]|nr:anhydro-N-acetylmuramic acid kinase [Flavobacteriaceae bacterium]
MNRKQYMVLGVMSGTSLDGIDLAHCIISYSEENTWGYTIEVAETVPYSSFWKNQLQEAVSFSEDRLKILDMEYTHYLGGVISNFIKKYDIENLDAICSHGHTILHRPDKGITLQIGNLPQLAELVNGLVVCDFRVQDVAMGGQGAPLVPIGDRLLFEGYDYCLNLGGFANCSFESNEGRIAYDICPVNVVLNHFAELLGFPYDDGGKMAADGQLDTELFNSLNVVPFYAQTHPKSLGLEWVQQHIFPLMKASSISVEDKLHTFTEHVAKQLARQFKDGSQVLVTGGGAYNAYLLERVRSYKNVNLVVPNSILVEFKEALVFALLGVLKLRNEVNCLASVTGASKDHSSGVIYIV